MTSATRGSRRDRRLDARVTAEDKSLFERAAALSGRSMSSFVVNTLREAARRVIREHETMQLSGRDRRAFVSALLEDAEPAEPLRRAARAYRPGSDGR